MKKLLTVMLALAVCLSLAACGGGEEKGIRLTNDLGVDLVVVELTNADGMSSDLPEGLSKGGTGQLRTGYGGKEGYVDIIADDVDGNVYKFLGVFMYDDVDVRMEGKPGDLWLRFTHYDGDAQYPGEFFPGDPVEPDVDPSGENAEDYYGDWKYEDYDCWIVICGDGTYDACDVAGNVEYGVFAMVDGLLELTYKDGITVLDGVTHLYINGEGSMIDNTGATLIPDTWPDFPEDDEDDDVGGVYHDPEDYLGYWQYPDGTVISIDEFGWSLYDDGGNAIDGGSVEYADNGAYLMTADGSSGGGKVCFDEYGDLMDGGQVLTWHETNPLHLDNPETLSLWLEGEWYYSGQELILYFDGVEYFVLSNGEGEASGVYEFDGDWVYLYYDGDGGEDRAHIGEDGYLRMEGDDVGYFYRSEDF